MSNQTYSYSFEDFIVEFNGERGNDSYTFENFPDNYGIVFKVGDDRFQIVDSQLGYRLLINNLVNYHSQDLPFHPGTEHFLPEGIKIIWKKCLFCREESK